MSARKLSVEDHAYWWKETGRDELCQILYWRWDPIGVSDAYPASRGEYNDYAGRILGALKTGKGPEEIAELLLEIETSLIGLNKGNEVTEAHRSAVAQLIAGWYPLSQELWHPSGRS